ncbi:MAG: 4-hydroxyproline epimerase [Armatimonadaceae bacterium]
MQKVSVIDSHTGGEPTRVIVSGGPDLGTGSMAERRERFQAEFDRYRRAMVCEPRGSDILVGALLCEPEDPACTAGVIFFNNVGYLGMCGHGTIGLMTTLAYLNRIAPGDHRLETPVGIVTAQLQEDGAVSVRNIPAYRAAKAVSVDVPGHGTVVGDVAYGGNWFYLVSEHGQNLTLENAPQLTAFCEQVRHTIHSLHPEVDHIELFSAPDDPANHSKNFVLCPGSAYDRSPCGTGTSAKLACLYADGKLQPGQVWRQESITGSVFTGQVEPGANGTVVPTITGTAFVTAETTLLLDPADPLCWGI